jgi:hypothetical protein
LTSEECTVAELKRAASTAMYYTQEYGKIVQPGPKPGKWTWRNSKFGHDLGPEIKPTTLLRAKHLFTWKITKVEAQRYKYTASSTDQHEQGFGILAKFPRAMMNKKDQIYGPPLRTTQTTDTIQTAIHISAFLKNREADRERSPNRTSHFKYQYIPSESKSLHVRFT